MPRRVLGAAVAMACIFWGGASAQVARESATPPGITFTSPPDPPPQAPPPAPGRDAHHLGPAAPPPGGDLFLAGPDTYAPRYDRRIPAKSRFHLPYGYFIPGYSPVAPVVTAHSHAPLRHGLPAGFLLLRVQPRTAQVYVDGFLIGTVDDFRGSGYALEPGTHRVELRAEGFEPRTVDVPIRSGETLTFRGELQRILTVPADATPPKPALLPPSPPKTIYIIPRCYAGDRLPTSADLPPGCSVSAVRVVVP